MKIEDEIKQQRFVSANQKAVINLLYTTNWLLAKQKDVFKSYNVTLQQFNIMRILRGQHPKSISATEIKARMLDKNSDVSRLLDRMIVKGLVGKKTSISDKRAADVNLTSEGLQLLAEMDKVQQKLDNILALNEGDALLLSDLLDKSRG
ncbi:MAG: MarR family transcriptional regulator [Chryseolinea sp.]